MSETKNIPLSKILHLYQKKRLTPKQIAARLGVTRQAIYYRLKSSGIPLRAYEWRYAKFPDKDKIERLYVRERLPIPLVAERLGETPHRIRSAMHRYGIPGRGRGGQPKYPQLRELRVGESVILPMPADKPHLRFYDMAKKGGIKVSVKRVGGNIFRVTRKA